MMRPQPASCRRPDDSAPAVADFAVAAAEDALPENILFVIGGFNGLTSVESWAAHWNRHARRPFARAYSWRDAQRAGRDIIAASEKRPVTLIGHSLGGGYAQLLSQQLPAGTIDTLVTVASYAPRTMDHDRTRENVRHWLNIVSAARRRGWRDIARDMAAPLLLGWREQGAIPNASDNHLSEFPHHDFYKLIADRYGAAGQPAI